MVIQGAIRAAKGLEKTRRTFMRVTRGHEERGVDFEAPATALDRTGGGELGEVSISGVRQRS